IVPKVIIFIKKLRSHYHTHRATRKIIDLSPDHGRNIKTVVRAIHVVFEPGSTIVKGDVETAGHRDQQLMEPLMRMTASVRTARHVVEVIHALDIERNVTCPLDKSQITARVFDFW